MPQMYNLPVIGSGLPDVANALMQKRMQEQESQRQNAQLELQQRRFGLEEQRYASENSAALDKQKLQRALAQTEWALQPGVTKENIQQAIPEIVQGFEQLHGPGSWAAADDGTVKRSAAEARMKLSAQLGLGPQPESIGSLYQVEGPQGAQYATAQQAVGQTPYRVPPQGATGTWSQPVEVTGPDGKPQLIQTHSVTGDVRQVKGFGPKAKPVQGDSTETKLLDAENLLAAIGESKKLIRTSSTGFFGQRLSQVGGTDARDLSAKLDTIKGILGFERLQRMREESKTGGALGQVAVRELELLQSTVAALDQFQSKGALLKGLERVEAQYTKAMAAYKAALKERGGAQQADSSDGAVDFSALPRK